MGLSVGRWVLQFDLGESSVSDGVGESRRGGIGENGHYKDAVTKRGKKERPQSGESH